MYAKLVRNGVMDLTKTYTEPTNVPDTNDVNWDGSSNGMNDKYDYVTTQAKTWVWLFKDENYSQNGGCILVGPNSADYNLKDNGFDHKVGSFKVCGHDPTLV